MLMVTNLLAVARDPARSETLARAPSHRFAPEHRRAPVVVWNVNRQCNMTCPHCYAAAHAGPGRGELDTAAGLALLERLAEAGVRILIFSGGEPLLRADLPRLIARAGELGMAPQLSTNGTLIDAPMAARLKRLGVGYVGVSIDGPADYNDAYRGMPGGFASAVDGLRHARAAGLRTGLRMTVHRGNRAHLEAMLALAGELGAQRFYLSHLVYSGRGVRLADQDLAPAEARALLAHLFGLAAAALERGTGPDVVTGSNDSDGPLLLQWIRGRYGPAAAQPVEALLRRRGGNSAGEGIIAIDPRGRVHPDQFWHRAVLGRLPDQPLADILAHPLCGQLRERRGLLRGRCGACRFVALCRGSHRERAQARHGDPWAPDPACVMTDAEVLGDAPRAAAS